MYLLKDKLQHISTVAHEGKVVVLATDAEGKISYTVKQDGFEDSYLNTPADQRTGWENWKPLEFANETDDQSVIEKEKAELTHQQDPSKYLLKSLYKTEDITAVAPVQAISALGHIYVFRQSKSNTLLVDRFILDSMTNKLNRKLEVRFKRSKRKHEPTKNMQQKSSGLVNIDTLDFRDADGNFFYEPTTELCLVNNLHKGWFSVVLVPTAENDVYRWHIFAYNSQTRKVELTTIRASEEGLFEVKDYTVFEESNDSLVPRKIPGVIKRTLEIKSNEVGVTVTNGLSATKYDLQQAQQTQSGEEQLLKTATRLMLAIPTDKGTAAFSFAIAGDGTLGEIDRTPDSQIIRSRQREILLPLNTLDEIKAIGDRTPPPQGIISGFAEATDAEDIKDIEDLVKISTNSGASELANYDLVKISGTSDYQGLYQTIKVDENTFDVAIPSNCELGYWEKQDKEEGGLIFDGMITAYQKIADGTLRVTCPNHGLENGDQVQIAGTEDYNNTYPVRKIDDTHFVIERKWAVGEAVNVKLVSQKRRGIVFDGVDDYIELAQPLPIFSSSFTISMWVKVPANLTRGILLGDYQLPKSINVNFEVSDGGKLRFFWSGEPNLYGAKDLRDNQWHFISFVRDRENKKISGYIDGVLDFEYSGEVSDKQAVIAHRIGRDSRGGATSFQGKIADLRVWKIARTAEEIKNSMYLQLTGKEVGLVGYWRLGGISEGKVVDFSVNGNDGTVYGETYVSAATLNRELAGGTRAVKYSNPELFAVSERATYEESFEFKVNSPNPDSFRNPNNADGRNTKIFTFSYWGKTSRSAEEKKIISAVQNDFEYLGDNWYRASCNVTIPDEVSVLRSFEIAKVQGDWQSLEIRKHRIRLLSDSITEAKYTDGVSLATLADDYATSAAKLKALEEKEKEEGVLLKEKQDLEAKLAGLKDLPGIQKRANDLTVEINSLESQRRKLRGIYDAAVKNPLNYWCFLQHKQTGLFWEHLEVGNAAGVELIPSHGDDWTKWKFLDAGGGYYYIQHKRTGLFCRTYELFFSVVLLHPSYGDDSSKWKFTDAGEGYSYIQNKQTGKFCEHVSGDSVLVEMISSHGDNWTKWKFQSTQEQANDKIETAYQNLQAIVEQISLADSELRQLEEILKGGTAKKGEWEARLLVVNTQITGIQSAINSLNSQFLNAVVTIQAKPQTMHQVAKDSKGLVTQGALLGFVQPASRLNAIETCEGNVQLSYFDRAGRMRQTNYDVTADSKNAAFEQWIPDAERACLNFSKRNSVVTLDKPFYLVDDWSVEAWFVYPLPNMGEWNTLIRGNDVDNHILLVRNRKQLGTYLTNDSLGNNFYDSGFNMELLTEGWHHVAAVGRGDTTLFYIDGKKVGDVKAKALKDAEENLKKKPNDEAAKKKVEDIKKASLKAKNNVAFIGNRQQGGEPFGKVAEVRVWGVALSDDEIAVNSTTLLSGNEPGLLAYYPMSEATGVDVRDHSGNGNNAKVSGADWWGCTAAIGKIDNTVMNIDNRVMNIDNRVMRFYDNTVMTFDGKESYIHISTGLIKNVYAFTLEGWVKAVRKEQLPMTIFRQERAIGLGINSEGLFVNSPRTGQLTPDISGLFEFHKWHHVAVVGDGQGVSLYLDGEPIITAPYTSSDDVASSSPFLVGTPALRSAKGLFAGYIAEVRIWNKARTQAEIQADAYKRLSGKEAGLIAYYPLNEIKEEGNAKKVLDLAGNNHGTVNEVMTVDDSTLPIVSDALPTVSDALPTVSNALPTVSDAPSTVSDALVCAEYSTVTLESSTKTKVAVMRRFFAFPAADGVTLLPDKRIEALELKWIGNGQFAPTLLGYIEGPPPVPSENLTLSDDYNGATSVELTMSEDVEFSWNRSQDSGLGATIDTFIGAGGTMSILTAPMGVGTSIDTSTKIGVKGDFEFSYQFQNESNITSSSSLSMTDKLELRGTPEETTKFPHLGNRFIPKNIGYALVVSTITDVFVTRLARSGKMVGYQVQPVDGIPPDVNTITFLMNPAYTMNGSLDGMTGSSPTSDRFFKHVPEMRSQYGSLYPASYYRLKEAYDLKRQIEAEDKRRESYFHNFNVRTVDELSLDRNIDSSGPAPTFIGVQQDKPDGQITGESQNQQVEQFQADAAAASDQTNAAAKAKQAEIQKKITDQEKRVQATDSFASWQRRMEDIQIRAGKRNIVNTYVWDADGGLRTEAQSFANTVEHTIGGSFGMNAGLGAESAFSVVGFDVELTYQTTVNLTQTMSKTEARSKGFQLNVDLSGLEYKGITDYNDRPIIPGEKVDRYRFMSFYLEGSTNHFHDFFSYVVDPEWLRSNDEEARALRETQAGKPNKAWRVLHRVTYVERPALMGFGRDLRKLRATAAVSENQALLDKITKLEEENQKLEEKLNTIISLLKGQQ